MVVKLKVTIKKEPGFIFWFSLFWVTIALSCVVGELLIRFLDIAINFILVWLLS